MLPDQTLPSKPTDQRSQQARATRSLLALAQKIPVLLWGYLLLLLLILGCYLWIPGAQSAVAEAYTLFVNNDRRAIEAWVVGFGWWGPLLILILMIAQTIVSAIPMILVLVVAIVAYGPVWGGLLGWFGAILAALVGYGLGRTLGDGLQARFVNARLRQLIADNVARYGGWAILALRISPLVPSDGVSFVAGLVRMGFWPFLLGTIGGVTPVVLVVAYFGSDFARLRLGVVAVTLLSLGGLLTFVVWDKFLRPQRAATLAEPRKNAGDSL
jgi:uncharacterized membrane protein YdjX (TVP38/TMEM64 family)